MSSLYPEKKSMWNNVITISSSISYLCSVWPWHMDRWQIYSWYNINILELLLMKRENLFTNIKLSYVSTNICFEGKKIPTWQESQRVEWCPSTDLNHPSKTSIFVPFLPLHISKESRLILSVRLATVLNLGETGVEQEERWCLHFKGHMVFPYLWLRSGISLKGDPKPLSWNIPVPQRNFIPLEDLVRVSWGSFVSGAVLNSMWTDILRKEICFEVV